MKKIILGLLIVLSLLVLSGCSSDKNSPYTNELKNTQIASNTEFSGDVFEISLDEVSNQLKKYDYTSSKGINVKFFAIKGSNGGVRTAFDACDVCGGYKGYRQEGGDIVCNNCGRHFDINGLGTQNKGYGCWPSYLSHKIESGKVIINTAELEAGAYRFA